MNKPKKQTVSSAKDVFSYLLMIGMMYTGIVSLIALLFQYINVQFPDYIDFYYGDAVEVIKASMSALLIGWPVFILISWLISKDLKLDREKASIWIRKWMLHLTAFVSAVTIIVDLITLVNNFLDGELSVRFGLKVLAILVIAAAVFGYMLWELRRDVSAKTKIPTICAITSSVLMLGFIILGFFIVGTPAQRRDIRMDAQRVSDLQAIQYRLTDEWTTKGEIPETVAELNDPIYGFLEPTDPETGEKYSYTKKGEFKFELCATFEHTSMPDDYAYSNYEMYPYGGYSNDSMSYWNHGEGYVCFERAIDPQLYPVQIIK